MEQIKRDHKQTFKQIQTGSITDNLSCLFKEWMIGKKNLRECLDFKTTETEHQIQSMSLDWAVVQKKTKHHGWQFYNWSNWKTV